jgi:hypothetical protein
MNSTSEPAGLQFERADFADGDGSTPTCRVCQRRIDGTYFEVNGLTACAGCRNGLIRRYAGSAGPLGLVKAIGAGLGAGIGGALIYYAVLAITGYELGLIAVLVGFMVGTAVRWGSGGRGGASYQAIAVVITYVAIVGTYVPFIVAGISERAAARHHAAGASSSTTTPPTGMANAGSRARDGSAPAAAGTPATDASRAATPDADRPAGTAEASANRPPLTASGILFSLVFLVAFLLASPFLAGFGNIIGWAIIGFALYEAWKRNRRVRLDVAGPFTVTASAPAPAPVVASS